MLLGFQLDRQPPYSPHLTTSDYYYYMFPKYYEIYTYFAGLNQLGSDQQTGAVLVKVSKAKDETTLKNSKCLIRKMKVLFTFALLYFDISDELNVIISNLDEKGSNIFLPVC